MINRDWDENNFRFFVTHASGLALTIAIVHQPIQLLAWLLWYKAPPLSQGQNWRRPFYLSMNPDLYAEDSLSAYELAVLYGQTEKANLISREVSKRGRNPAEKEIIQATKYQTDNVVSKVILLDGKEIITRLTLVSALTDPERKIIQDLFKSTFDSLDSQDDLNHEFELEFSWYPHRLIDIYYCQNEIIGFNLLEIIKPNPDQFKKHLFVYGAYSAIKEEHRGMGIMQFFTFRLAYALKQLNPDFVVGVTYLAIHYNSYRLANKFIHWPKYQNAYTTALAQHLLDLVMPGDYHFVHKGLMAYVELNMIVKPNAQNDQSSPLMLDEQMFNEELLGLKKENTNSKKQRSLPMIFAIDSQTITTTLKHAEQMGFNFQRHIQDYAQSLSEWMHQHKIEIRESSDDSHSFFRQTYIIRDLDKCINLTKPKL